MGKLVGRNSASLIQPLLEEGHQPVNKTQSLVSVVLHQVGGNLRPLVFARGFFRNTLQRRTDSLANLALLILALLQAL